MRETQQKIQAPTTTPWKNNVHRCHTNPTGTREHHAPCSIELERGALIPTGQIAGITFVPNAHGTSIVMATGRILWGDESLFLLVFSGDHRLIAGWYENDVRLIRDGEGNVLWEKRLPR
jgi:hypothetical protein